MIIECRSIQVRDPNIVGLEWRKDCKSSCGGQQVECCVIDETWAVWISIVSRLRWVSWCVQGGCWYIQCKVSKGKPESWLTRDSTSVGLKGKGGVVT